MQDKTKNHELPVSRKRMVAQAVVNLMLPLFFIVFPVFWSFDRYYTNAASDPEDGNVFWEVLRGLADKTEPQTHFECAPEANGNENFVLLECDLQNLRRHHLALDAQGLDFWMSVMHRMCPTKVPLFAQGCGMRHAYYDNSDLEELCLRTGRYCREQNWLRKADATLQPPIAIYHDARRLLRQYADRLESAAHNYKKIRPIFWIVMFGWALLQVLALVGTVVMTRKAYLMVQASKAQGADKADESADDG